MASNNFKYGLYDVDEVVPGYFGATEPTNDDTLKSLGLFDEDVKPSISSLASNIKSKGFGEQLKEGVFEVGTELASGLRVLGSDFRKIQTGRLDETKGLLGKFLQAGEGRLEKIEEINKAVDDAGGGEIDKKILQGLNILGAGVDFGGDVLISTLKTLAPKSLEDATIDTFNDFSQSEFGGEIIELYSSGLEKWEQFKQTSPEANRFGLTVESFLPLGEVVTGGAGAKLTKEVGGELIEAGVKVGKEGIEKATELGREGVETIKEIPGKISITREDDLLKKLKLETTKGIINGAEVDIPKIDKSVVETLSTPFRESDIKVLAGRALSPRTVGKSAKQKLESIQNVEKNANNFYKNIRTGVIEGDIDTIENAAQTVVDNIDTIGARIGNAVKKVDGTIKIENDITDSVIGALGAKGASVSPATQILTKFLDDLGDGDLSISDAFELKKVYGNEVSKLYKAGDSGTKQYKALSDGVKFINKKIDEIIDTQLGDQFAGDKAIFRNLKLIVDDIVASTLVEGRRSPNTFAEQIGMIEGILSPVSATKQIFIKEIGELNTRGGAWKELIKIYDQKAIRDFNK